MSWALLVLGGSWCAGGTARAVDAGEGGIALGGGLLEELLEPPCRVYLFVRLRQGSPGEAVLEEPT